MKKIELEIVNKNARKTIYYKGDKKLKAAGVELAWTHDAIIEYQRCKDDILYFIENYVKIISLDEGIIPFKLRNYQRDMVKLFDENNRVICLLSRQVGKTVTSMAYILHYIIFNSHKNVLVLANRGDTARSILAKLKEYYKNLPFFLQSGVVEWSKSSVELENGCKIHADGTSESAGRSESVSLLYLDEFAFVPNGQAADFMRAVYPTVSSSKTSKIIICSTCNGLNHYYKMWNDASKGRNEFIPFTVPWNAIPGRDEEFKRKTISDIGQDAWDVEYENKFLGSSGTLISGIVLSRLTYDDPIFDENYLTLYERVKHDHIYVITVDPSEGLGLDYTVVMIHDITKLPYKQVGLYRNNSIDPHLVPDIIDTLGKMFNNAYVLIEANNIGNVVCSDMHYLIEYENLVRTTTAVGKMTTVSTGFGKNKSIVGLKTTKSTKRIGCSYLKSLVENDQYIIRDFTTIQELSTFSRKGDTYQAEDDCNDDTCMALVLFSWLVNDSVFKEIIDVDLKEKLKDRDHCNMLRNNILPFGFYSSGLEEIEKDDPDEPDHLKNGAVWGWGNLPIPGYY